MIVLFEKGVIASFKLPFRQIKSSLLNVTVSAKNTSVTNMTKDQQTIEDKLIEESEKYLESLMGDLDDDLWWDMLIPACVAVVATVCVWITRRLRMIQEQDFLMARNVPNQNRPEPVQ